MIIRKSVLRRFLFLSIVASIVPVAGIGLLYDRLTNTALERMLGERISGHLAATGNRLGAFIENRRYQAETIANYPGIAALADNPAMRPPSDIAALLQVEADQPDLYGILFFDRDGRLTRVIPGQAASGSAYWNDKPFRIDALPKTRIGQVEVVGPMAPHGGESGWFLVMQPIPDSRGSGAKGHFVALHVRLASLGEQLGSTAAIGALQPLLRTPSGDFDNVGHLVHARQRVLAGPEFMSGWMPMLEVEPAGVVSSLEAERKALLVAVIGGVAAMIWFYYRLSSRLRWRMRPLLAATEAISMGRWGHRIPEEGDDEIAAVSQALNTMSGKLQETLNEAVRMERLAVLGEFATRIAHEVRNPLASLKTTSQALARREADSKRKQLLIDMENEIDRLADVVSDLVRFGRPRAPRLSPFEVREVFRKASVMADAKAQERGVSVTCVGESELHVMGDQDQLGQVVLNLVLNAVEASKAGGVVVLRASREKGLARLEVTDAGHGIPDEIRDRVLEPFFTTKSRGVGLGLSIARQLVEMNDGKIGIDSQAGRGTTVYILLPLAH